MYAKLDDETNLIMVTLSRKNLEALTKMLNDGRTSGAISSGDISSGDGAYHFLVQGQENEEHYKAKGMPAGKMSWERDA